MFPLAIIVARSKNHVIGNLNQLPWAIPEDMQFFREQTLGYPVIMGRNTWNSLGGRPLTDRLNIVISRTDVLHPEVLTFRTLSDAQVYLRLLTTWESAFVIGGSQLYREALFRARELVITEIDAIVEGDTTFEVRDLHDPTVWTLAERMDRHSVNSITHPHVGLSFRRYMRVGL